MFKQGELLNGTYKIIESIGSGGGGEIYKAYHTHLDCYVAVKLIKDNIKGKLDDRAEADILKKIKHSYLPQVYDFVITDEGDVYTVMEFVEGMSFSEHLKNGKTFTNAQVIKYAKQACEALSYLHTRKPAIVHSDIKPANIMLTPDDNICIIDFNISSVLSEGGAFAVGKSDGYSPPEQYVKKNKTEKAKTDKTSTITETEILGETEFDSFEEDTSITVTTITEIEETEAVTDIVGEEKEETDITPEKSSSFASKMIVSKAIIDERSDVYALGATLYHLISGKRPEKSTDGVTPINKLDTEASYGLRCIISKAMENSPKKRYANAGEMLIALENIHSMEKLYKSFTLRNRIIYALLILGTAFFSVLAFMGYKRIGTENAMAYKEYTEKLVVLREKGDEKGFEEIYQKAEAIYNDRLDIHFQKALFLFEKGEYDNCLSYMDEMMRNHPEYTDDAEMADLLFVHANCYFEKEDYSSAIIKYKSAIDKKSDNGEYYRDYAISLARTGEPDKASEVLKRATELGLSEENICLVDGEIDFVREKYKDAENSLLKCISVSSDDYIKQRAYILINKVYSKTGETEKNTKILEKAIKELPEERLYSIYELLSQCYLDMGKETGENDYYLKAVDIFSVMQKKGLGGYRVSENKAVAYYTIGDCKSAKAELNKMKEDFGENYRTDMYLAFCELREESEKSNNKRDYSDFLKYYNNAKSLYEKEAEDGMTDMEMQVLEDTYHQLKEGNWF